MEKLRVYRNYAGDQTYAIPAGHINNYVLTADVNKAVSVPAGARYAIFAADEDIWVKIGGAAAIPSGDITDGTGSELNPGVRWVEGETTIGVISAYAAKVSLMFFQ